jgi:hypothetical protein
MSDFNRKWYHIGNECLRCNNKGYVPVLYWKKLNENTIAPYVSTYMCGCEFSKDHYSVKEVEEMVNGKRNTREKRIIISERFDDVFNEMQFTWNEAIIDYCKYVKIDYHEAFLAGQYKSLREFKKTGKPEILTDYDYYEREKNNSVRNRK